MKIWVPEPPGTLWAGYETAFLMGGSPNQITHTYTLAHPGSCLMGKSR